MQVWGTSVSLFRLCLLPLRGLSCQAQTPPVLESSSHITHLACESCARPFDTCLAWAGAWGRIARVRLRYQKAGGRGKINALASGSARSVRREQAPAVSDVSSTRAHLTGLALPVVQTGALEERWRCARATGGAIHAGLSASANIHLHRHSATESASRIPCAIAIWNIPHAQPLQAGSTAGDTPPQHP